MSRTMFDPIYKEIFPFGIKYQKQIWTKNVRILIPLLIPKIQIFMTAMNAPA